MQIFPTSLLRLIKDNAAIQYLQQFTQAPPKFVAIVVGISPFSYIAVEPGNIFVNGGTVSAVHLFRGSDDLDFTGQKLVPVSINDIVKVTYTVLPTITFLPIYGASPR